MRTSTLSLSLALAAALAVGSAHADTGNQEIDRGIALYDDLEYETAVEVLAAALAVSGLSTEELTEGYAHLGLAHLALGQKAETRAAFEKLLAADPRYELPRTVSPEALDIFADVKRALPPPDQTAAVRLTQAASPLAPRVGAAVSVTATVVDPGRRHDRVIVYHRIRGSKSYSEVKAAAAVEGRYAATISGAFVKPPALEYYVAALDPAGQIVAAEGSAEQPLSLPVDEGRRGGAPIYARWWFWGAIGAVAATTAAILVLSGGDEPDPDATVTITIDYP
jgi:tetratricopeptide (TPR) repeat protein